MNASAVVQSVVGLLAEKYASVVPFGRSRLYQCGTDLTCSINYSKLLRGHKFFFGLSKEVADPDQAFPPTDKGSFVLLVCATAEAVLVLPRPLVLRMLEGVSTRRLDVFLDDGRYILQTTGHSKLDVTRYLNAYPLPEKGEGAGADGIDPPSDEGTHSIRDHVAVQWALIRLGRAAGHSVWVPMGDRHLGVEGHGFDSYTLSRFPHLGFDEITRRIVANIDVLWLDGNVIRKAFEIESTTAIYSGLLRLNDLMLSQPNNQIETYITSGADRKPLVARQLMRPSFRPIIERCQFLDFQNVKSQIEKLEALSVGDGDLRVSGLIRGERFEMPDHLLYPPGAY
jgi:hypothetical protein